MVRHDFFSFFFFFKYGLDVLPFEMFDNIFVGSSAVFPNRPGPVEHKTKGDYDKKWKRKPGTRKHCKSKGKRKEKRVEIRVVEEIA